MLKKLSLRKRISSVYLLLCLASFISLDLSFRYVYSHIFIRGMLTTSAVIFTISWSVLLTAVIALLPGVIKRIFMIATITLFGILMIAHSAMYGIFHNFLSFADIMYAGDGAKFFSFTYLNIRKLLFLAFAFSTVLMGIAAWGAPARIKKGKHISPLLYILILLTASIAIFATHNKLITSGNKHQMNWDSVLKGQAESSLYTDFTNANLSMGIAGLYQYTVRNLIVSTGLERWFQTSSVHKSLDEIFLERQGTHQAENSMTGSLAGKNVIMIMLESIDTWMLTEEYMPNLYSVEKDSIQFANHYSPLFINAATFNTEFTALTGLIPPTAGIKQSVYTTNNFSWALPNLFKQQGYRAESFHSAKPIVYDRGLVHQNLGFSSYISRDVMGMDDQKLDTQLIRGYDMMTASEPFFDFIITYSGHGPYTDEHISISAPHMERAVAAAQTSGITGSDKNMNEYYRAVAHAMETDAFIGELFTKLESDGLLENTVLIFFADHYSKYFSDASFIMDIKNVDTTDLLYNTPFFIYSKDIEPTTVTKLTSSIDIYPTIVNLFDLQSNLDYFVGDDAFGPNGNIVMFRNYAWYDGETYYSADYKGDLTEEMAARNTEVRERINLSWDTLTSDYFDYLLKKDDALTKAP